MSAVYTKLFEEILDVDWNTDGDEVYHHLSRLLTDRTNSRGHKVGRHEPTAAEPFVALEYAATGGSLRSQLLLVPVDGGVEAWVRIASPDEIPQQVAPWAEALRDAVAALSAEHPEHPWWAVVGPGGDQHNTHVAVEAPGDVGPLRVSASVQFVDAFESPVYPSLSAWSYTATYPVIVEGVARGYGWTTASTAAARDVSRLATLLAVAFDSGWRVRMSPTPFPIIPEAIPRRRLTSTLPDQGTRPNEVWPRDDVPLPAWLTTSWHRAAKDEAYRRALDAHHQGRLMEGAFPSQAFVQYVACVEGLGAALTSDTGAKARFLAGLARVVPEAERGPLQATYQMRSGTAHVGRLHGGENIVGAHPMPPLFGPRPQPDTFRYGVLLRMRSASRDLLLDVLAGPRG